MTRTVDERLEELLLKVPGKYKLVTLFQKRLRELQRGMPPLTDVPNGNLWDIAGEEILAGKVELVLGEEAEKIRRDAAAREAEEEKQLDAPKAAKKEKEG